MKLNCGESSIDRQASPPRPILVSEVWLSNGNRDGVTRCVEALDGSPILPLHWPACAAGQACALKDETKIQPHSMLLMFIQSLGEHEQY